MMNQNEFSRHQTKLMENDIRTIHFFFLWLKIFVKFYLIIFKDFLIKSCETNYNIGPPLITFANIATFVTNFLHVAQK